MGRDDPAGEETWRLESDDAMALDAFAAEVSGRLAGLGVGAVTVARGPGWIELRAVLSEGQAQVLGFREDPRAARRAA